MTKVFDTNDVWIDSRDGQMHVFVLGDGEMYGDGGRVE